MIQGRIIRAYRDVFKASFESSPSRFHIHVLFQNHLQCRLACEKSEKIFGKTRREYIPVDSDAAATASAPNYDASRLASRRLEPASLPHTVLPKVFSTISHHRDAYIKPSFL